MTATNIDILSINEHHTNENDIIPPNNTYQWVGSPCLEGKRKAGGTGFLIRRTLNWKVIDSLPDDCQKLFIEVDSNGKRLLVGSLCDQRPVIHRFLIKRLMGALIWCSHMGTSC